MESLKPWLPLLISFIGLVGGAIIYQIQKATDRKNQILQERRDLYRKVVVSSRELLASFFDGTTTPELILKHVNFSTLIAELLVCAPDGVVKAVKFFEKTVKAGMFIKLDGQSILEESEIPVGGDRPKTKLRSEYEEIESAFDSLIYEMRRDTFGDSEITKAFLSAIVDGFPLSIGIRIP